MTRTFIELAQEAQLHKETYSATLKSVLRLPGTKQSLAEQVGISPQYLSYLLDPYDPRTPGPEVAEKIATALPLDPEQRESLFEHLFLASQRRLEQRRALHTGSSTPPLAAQVATLGCDHHLATMSTDPFESRSMFLAVRDKSRALLKQVNPHVTPLPAIQICFVLHDTQCLLNRPDDALYHAKLARMLIENLDRSTYRAQREYIDRLEFHAIRATTVACFNLNLLRQAADCCEEAEITRAMRERPEECKPHLLRDKLNTLSHASRFTLREAEELAHEVSDLAQRCSRADDPIWEFLMQRSLGRAYFIYGSFAKAHRIFEALLNQLHHIPGLGPVPKTLFLNAYAKLLFKQGHIAEWQEVLKRAVHTAADTGISQQFVELRQSYGPTMGPLLSEMGLVPTEEAVLAAT
jgi:tetratricopeptide (TPR) repeat protein